MFDVCIIGGGVVGTAILNKLTRLGKSCALIEIQNDVGFGASRANTALIHSGIDCKPGTLKAKLNVRGNALFPSLAKRLGVPFVQNGHLIVGNDEDKLIDLVCRADKNGVKGVKLLRGAELHSLEPNLSKAIKSGLFVPSGGMISSYNLAVAFVEESILNGASVLLEFDTKTIIKQDGEFVLKSTDGRIVCAKSIINACGEGYNKIANLIGSEEYDLIFRRGEYFLLDRTAKEYALHPVFPLPTEYSKGILVSPTVHGNILVGPTSIVSDCAEITTEEGLNIIKKEVASTFENVPFKENIRVFSGVRTICGEDFIIEKSGKVDGVINIAGICSPGLSASPAIAEFVAELLGLKPNKEKRNLKKRKPLTALNEMTMVEQNKIIKNNPDFGKVVCRCENISLGEIKECLNSPLPVKSVDAVKRRTRAGMGRCQGGFCIFQVMEEIAKANKIEFSEVVKDGVDSQIIRSKIKPVKVEK